MLCSWMKLACIVVSFKKLDWIVSVCWYLFAPSKTSEEGEGSTEKDIMDGYLVMLLSGASQNQSN